MLAVRAEDLATPLRTGATGQVRTGLVVAGTPRIGTGETIVWFAPVVVTEAKVRRNGADAVRALFPGYGRFRSAELVTNEVGAGDVLVLEDGHPHEVTSDGGLITLDVKTWNRSSGQEPLLLQDYLARRDMDELPLVRLV